MQIREIESAATTLPEGRSRSVALRHRNGRQTALGRNRTENNKCRNENSSHFEPVRAFRVSQTTMARRWTLLGNVLQQVTRRHPIEKEQGSRLASLLLLLKTHMLPYEQNVIKNTLETSRYITFSLTNDVLTGQVNKKEEENLSSPK